MSSRGHTRNAVAMLLVVLCLSTAVGGCGDGSRKVEYVITVDGEEVGGASVSVGEDGGERTYTGTERRPFLACDSTMGHQLTLFSEGARLQEYSGERQVPGASYTARISPEGNGYRYLSDGLQTFEYVAALLSLGGVLPFEPDSPCLLQALLDRFLAAGAPETTLAVVIPSRPAVLRELLLEKDGGGNVKVSGEAVGELDLRVDEDGVLLGVSGPGGLEIERGSPGSMGSKPFAPSGGARKVREVRIPTDGSELSGSLYFPRGEKPYPAVVLVSDFGPWDRTGAGFMSQVADRLAGEGMAVLTCDKRGIPESEGDYGTYTLESAVGDLSSQLDYLSLRGDIDNDHIFAVGYGEGGAIVARTAEFNPYISACVLMATPSVRMFPDMARVYAEQGAATGRLTPREAEAAENNVTFLEQVLDECRDDEVKLGGQELFLGWMRSYKKSDPLGTIASLKVPVLVMQGEKDDVVPASQATQIMDVLSTREKGGQELILYPELGHGFGRFVPEGEDLPYRAHSLIEDEVLGDMARWLKGH